MSDEQEIITLPADGDEDAAAALQAVDVASLSPEARLATALVVQAQALEGMRRSQTDLLRRLERAGGREDTRAALRALGDTLERVCEVQQTVSAQVDAGHRRVRRWLVAAVVALLAGVGGTAYWVTQDVRSGRLAPLEQEQLQAALRAADAGERAAVQRAVASLGASFETLTGQVDEHDQLAASAVQQLAGERDLAQRKLGQARGERTRLAQALAERDEQLRSSRLEQEDLLRTNTALRSNLVRTERRHDELLASLEDVGRQSAERAARPAAMAPSPPMVVPALVASLNQALDRGGAHETQVAGVGALRDGALHDLLLVREGRASRVRIARVDQRAGVPLLRLEGVRGQDGSDEPDGVVELPEADLAGLERLGLTVPDFTPLSAVRDALMELLAPTGYRVVGVEGCRDGELLGVVLKLEDEQGVLLRMLTANRGWVRPEVPELVLEEGSVRAGGEERPFFRGTFRLPLPGADLVSWSSTVASAGP